MSNLNESKKKQVHTITKKFILKRCNYENFEWSSPQPHTPESTEQSDSDYIPEEESDDDDGVYTDAQLDELLSDSETYSNCPKCNDRNA
jgi:hypothetical protein